LLERTGFEKEISSQNSISHSAPKKKEEMAAAREDSSDDWSRNSRDDFEPCERQLSDPARNIPEEKETIEHDVPAGNITYFEPKLYLQRYDYVLNYVEKTKAKTVIDLGCAECKFVRELAKLQLKRVVGTVLCRFFRSFILKFRNRYSKRAADEQQIRA